MSLQLGDIVYVEWFDTSVGKSMRASGVIDVPVKCSGRFFGLFGLFGRKRQAHHSGSQPM